MPDTPRKNDAHFDQWLFAEGVSLRELVHQTKSAIQQYEVAFLTRKRVRRAHDQTTFDAVIESVVCNLAFVSLGDEHPKEVSYPRDKARKTSRYDNPVVLSKTFTATIDTMAGAGILVDTRGTQQTGRSTFRPSESFMSEFEGYGVTKADIGRSEGDEPIILKARKHGCHHSGTWFEPKKAVRVEYADSHLTKRFRSEMVAINQHLKEADLEFIDDGLQEIDTLDRRLRRYFAVVGDDTGLNFDKGGRLFGGWWMNLPKARREHIRIDGKPCHLLDYASMFARLAYARRGQKAPHGDLYDLTGFLKGFDTAHRKGVKKVFNALMFGGASAGRFPKDTKHLLPKGCRVGDVRAAIEAKHDALLPMFGTMAGYDLMMDESRILVANLLTLNDLGITALPLHDGLLVSERDVAETTGIMLNKSQEIGGFSIPVTTKTYGGEGQMARLPNNRSMMDNCYSAYL